MWLWSWVLTVIGVVSIAIAGRHPALGWSIGFFAQALWVIYAFQAHQYGFLASAALFSVTYGRNWRLATKRDREEKKEDVRV